jgi:hypothetical protein
MGLEVNEAARRVTASHPTATPPSPRKTDKGVLRALEETLALERMRTVAAAAFTHEVLGGEADADSRTEEREHALAAARKLGGRVGGLSARVGRVLGGGDLDLLADAEDVEGEGEDVERLLRAIVLYRRVFGSPAPISAPKAKDADAHALRRTLGSSEVFEDALVEEARDRVVDLLTGQ